jgi:hypothetical protein
MEQTKELSCDLKRYSYSYTKSSSRHVTSLLLSQPVGEVLLCSNGYKDRTPQHWRCQRYTRGYVPLARKTKRIDDQFSSQPCDLYFAVRQHAGFYCRDSLIAVSCTTASITSSRQIRWHNVFRKCLIAGAICSCTAATPASCYACEPALSPEWMNAQADLCTEISMRSTPKTG